MQIEQRTICVTQNIRYALNVRGCVAGRWPLKGFKVVNFCDHIVLIAGRFKKGLPCGTILEKWLTGKKKKETASYIMFRDFFHSVLPLKMCNSDICEVALPFLRKQKSRGVGACPIWSSAPGPSARSLVPWAQWKRIWPRFSPQPRPCLARRATS